MMGYGGVVELEISKVFGSGFLMAVTSLRNQACAIDQGRLFGYLSWKEASVTELSTKIAAENTL